MTSKKSNFLSQFVFDAAAFIFSLFKLVPNLVLLIELEARAAKRSLISLLIMTLIACVLLTSIWICTLILIFIYLQSLLIGMTHAIVILLGINIILLAMIMCCISKSKRNVAFPQTRHYLRNLNN